MTRFNFLAITLLLVPFHHALAADIDFSRDIQPIFLKHCHSCHGPEKQKGGLRLDVKSAAIQGGDGGPAWKAGKADDSEIIKRVRGDEPDDIMPPKGDPLTKDQIALLTKWIASGATWPDSGDAKLERRKSDHWSFQQVVRPALPKVTDASWPRNGIDHFILAKLEAQNIKPSPEADRYTLIRRLYLDLLGLLPTPEEADAFVKDTSKDAYEKLAERLLASPHYGERWGRHWLDQARYADSNGYSVDSPRTMWPYRDWVIKAINDDMPFDEFTIAQLAGDLLIKERQAEEKSEIRKPTASTAAQVAKSEMDLLIATAFHRNTMINQEGGVKDDQFRIEATYDRVATTTQVWLSLTMACAQCHTHKFDPITQKEYYQFFAFFNSTEDANNVGPTVSLASIQMQEREAQLNANLAAAEKKLRELDEAGKVDVPAGKTSIKTPKNQVEPSDDHQALAKQIASLKKEIADVRRTIPSVMVMRELPQPRQSNIFIRGDFLRLGPEVTPDVPEVLPALKWKGQETGDREQEPGARGQETANSKSQISNLKSQIPNPKSDTAKSIPDRLDLARWLVTPENPLTPRVTMNRLWLRYFPKGLVDTEEDFGTQGSNPTHPELLDWLASEFIAKKWSMKAMHRLLVTSATYRQSSNHRGDLVLIDPFNRLLARQSRLRVEAEIIRDVSLAASGLLSSKIGGPSVRPPQPAGVYDFTQNKQSWNAATGEDRYRRGMYTFFFRSAPYPMLATFDVPNLTQTCTARIRSNTPLQSLTLANDESMFEMAQGLASRVLSAGAMDDADRITLLFRLCLTRKPDAYEAKRLLAFLIQQRDRFTKDTSSAKQIAPVNRPKSVTDSEAAAWTTVARGVMNLDEFITRE